MRKKVKKRPVGVTRAVAEPLSYASVYAAKLAKQVAEFDPRPRASKTGKTRRKSGRR